MRCVLLGCAEDTSLPFPHGACAQSRAERGVKTAQDVVPALGCHVCGLHVVAGVFRWPRLRE